MILEAVILLGLLGHHHKPKPSTPPAIVQDSEEVADAKMFVMSVEDKFIPLYESDEKYARFEQVEIATVKADAALVHIAKTEKEFLDAVAKLHTDVDALTVIDEHMHIEEWT